MNELITCYPIRMPVGDQEDDVSICAIDLLKKESFIFFEDTVKLKRLADKFNFDLKSKVLIKLNDDVPTVQLFKTIDLIIKKKKNFIVISDSGIPGFCDPGSEIFEYLIKKYSKLVKIFPVGVATALDSALILFGKYASKGFVFFADGLRYEKIINEHKLVNRIDNCLTAVNILIFYLLEVNLKVINDILISRNLSVYLIRNISKKEIQGKNSNVYGIYNILKVNDSQFTYIEPGDDIMLVAIKK